MLQTYAFGESVFKLVKAWPYFLISQGPCKKCTHNVEMRSIYLLYPRIPNYV